MQLLKVISNHGREFENEPFDFFFIMKNMKFSLNSLLVELHTNYRVIKRKNMSLQNIIRTMIHETDMTTFGQKL